MPVYTFPNYEHLYQLLAPQVDFLTATVFRSSVSKELALCFSLNTRLKHLLTFFGQQPKNSLVAQAALPKIDSVARNCSECSHLFPFITRYAAAKLIKPSLGAPRMI